NSHSCAHTGLALLNPKIVQQGCQHILRPNGFGDETEGVVGGPTNPFLMCLEHIKELKAYSHPFSSIHTLWPSVGDTTNQVDGVLLHLLMAIAQDGREPR